MYETTDESNYEIQEVLNDRIIDGRLYYLVKWKGYPHQQNSWQPEEHLKNASEHLIVWKQRKNKLRKLDRVSKRKKLQESFDGDKYIKKNRPPGPLGAKKAQNQKLVRKSARILEKGDSAQARYMKDFSKDSDRASVISSTNNSSKDHVQKPLNPVLGVLASIKKIKQKRKSKQKNSRSFTNQQKDLFSNEQQANGRLKSKRRGRPKKGSQIQKQLQRNISKRDDERCHEKQKQSSIKTIDKDSAKRSYQMMDRNIILEKRKDKPEIYDEVLHHMGDNNVKSRFRNYQKFDKKNNQKKRRSSNFHNDLLVQQQREQQHRSKEQQSKTDNSKFWRDSPLEIFGSPNQLYPQAKKTYFDQLQQIALSDSKRLPNFKEKYGLRQARIKRKSNDPFVDGERKREKGFDKKYEEIEIESVNESDVSLMVIEKEDFDMGRKALPTKKIFLNEEYYEVSVNVDSYGGKSFGQQKVTPMQVILSPSEDPRYIHRARVAAQSLYDYLFDYHPTKRFDMKPQDYLQRLREEAMEEIRLREDTVRRCWVEEVDGVQGVNQAKGGQFLSKDVLAERVSKNIITVVSDKKDPAHPQQQAYSPFSIAHKKPPIEKVTIEICEQLSTDHSIRQSQQSSDVQLLQGLQEDIEDLFRQRYPGEVITTSIKEQVSSIVRKIAFEDLEMEMGLRMIDEWMDACDRVKGDNLQKAKMSNQVNTATLQRGNRENSKTKQGNEEGEMTFTEDSYSQTRSKPQTQPSNSHPVNAQTKPASTTTSAKSTLNPASQPSLPASKQPQVVQESSIVRIVSQFQYRGQQCYRLLLRNNQQVNVHYLELKKNSPKVLFEYLQNKCRQLERKEKERYLATQQTRDNSFRSQY